MLGRFFKGVIKYDNGDWALGFEVDYDRKWYNHFRVKLDLIKVGFFFEIKLKGNRR